MPRPRRVLLVSYWLDPGGTERQLAEIAKALDRARFEPHVGTLRQYGLCVDELRAAGVPLVEFPARGFLHPSLISAARVMGRYVREQRIDMVHAFDVPGTLFAVPVARWYRVPTILSSQRAYRSLTPRQHPFLRLTDRMVDGIVVNSRAVAETLVSGDRVPREKIHLCPNGVDARVFYPAETPLDGPLTIGLVAVLRPEKSIVTLLEAFARIRASHAGPRLTIVGSGSEEDRLRARAAELGIAEACHFEPAAKDVAAWLRKFDIFVLPSTSEALSNALMEAMACGCCAVASRVGGNPELIEDGVTGMLFQAGDAGDLAEKLRTLVGDRELRQRLARAGRERMNREFSTETSARRMEQIYDSVAQERLRG